MTFGLEDLKYYIKNYYKCKINYIFFAVLKNHVNWSDNEKQYLLETISEYDNEKTTTLVAFLYENGIIYEKDTNKAIELYEKSADQDEFNAIYRLGLIYEQGKIIDQNFEKAVLLHRKSAEHRIDVGGFLRMVSLGKIQMDNKTLIEIVKYYDSSYDNVSKSFIKILLKNLEMLVRENDKLKRKVGKLKYTPGNIGYLKAQENFENLLNQFDF